MDGLAPLPPRGRRRGRRVSRIPRPELPSASPESRRDRRRTVRSRALPAPVLAPPAVRAARPDAAPASPEVSSPSRTMTTRAGDSARSGSGRSRRRAATAHPPRRFSRRFSIRPARTNRAGKAFASARKTAARLRARSRGDRRWRPRRRARPPATRPPATRPPATRPRVCARVPASPLDALLANTGQVCGPAGPPRDGQG